MQLCIDARMVSCSGIGTFLKNLIPHFPPQSTTLLVYAEDLQKESWLKAYPIRICQSPIYSIGEQIEIPRRIPPCQIFWSPHYNVPLLPVRAKKRVVTIHDAAHLAFKESMDWKKNLYAQLMFRQAVTRSDRILTDSIFSQQELSKYLGISQEKITVVYPGVDVERFSSPPSPETQEALIKKYNLPPVFFFFIGNLKPHKNLKLIIDAYKQSDFVIPTVVAGKVDNLLQPDPLVKKVSKQIHIIGEVLDQEVPHFYKMATALIFPSFYEGFGLPPLEAMASGCPVIASNRASIPEVCGEAAYLINPDSPQELLTALHEITHNLDRREHFKKLGQSQMWRFSWNKTADHYTTLINSLK